MHTAVICRVLGIFLMLFSLTMLMPLAVSLATNDGVHDTFYTSFWITLASGALIWLPVYKDRADLRTREGFLVTSLFWTVLGIFGSIPFMLLESPELTTTDAIFESISGLTTTGATVITGLDYLPPSILFYRQLLQWLGGIGIIVIALAVLPMLGVGGMQLYRAETPGPIKDSKLTPRITETAKALFTIYLSMTLACALAYWLAGMTVFDAVCHSFSTVAIGGFSTHDASMGYFNSDAILWVGTIFMVLAGINFSLHFFAWKAKSLLHYRYDAECRFYLLCILAATAVTCSHLYNTSTYDISDSIVHGVFQVVSILTTTGFASADFSVWPSFLPFFLLAFAMMGGCAGSTAGGIKVIRVLLICKQGYRELRQLPHPNAVIPIKIGNRVVQDRVISAVWSFFAVYVIAFMGVLLAVMATGVDFTTGFSAVAASINNLGPGLGEVASHYGDLNDRAKWVLCFAMLLGRLEVFTLLVLFTPQFWRR